MKVAVPSTSTPKTAEIPLLPLVPEKVKYSKEDRIVFKLRVTPGEATSPTYDYVVPKLTGNEGL